MMTKTAILSVYQLFSPRRMTAPFSEIVMLEKHIRLVTIVLSSEYVTNFVSIFCEKDQNFNYSEEGTRITQDLDFPPKSERGEANISLTF